MVLLSMDAEETYEVHPILFLPKLEKYGNISNFEAMGCVSDLMAHQHSFPLKWSTYHIKLLGTNIPAKLSRIYKQTISNHSN